MCIICKHNVKYSQNRLFSAFEKTIIRVMAKEKIINIRVEADLKKQAKRLAENDGRSLSNWILKLIKNEIKKAQSDTEEK